MEQRPFGETNTQLSW